MTCLDCKKELSYADHISAQELLGIALCPQHLSRMEKLIELNNTPIEAIQLYYGLKEVGVNPMLEWWDGKKSVDIAISRVKLNIEVDTEYNTTSHKQAIDDLEQSLFSFNNGFTTIRIPHILIKNYQQETINNILGIMQGLRANIKVT